MAKLWLVWVHVFVWMVDILNKFCSYDFLVCLIHFIDAGFWKFVWYKHVQCANIVCNALIFFTFVSESFTRYPLSLLHHRDTILDIVHTYYSCHHTPHACQTLILLHECSTKTNIRHRKLSSYRYNYLLCVAGLRFVTPLLNEDWLIDGE